MPRARAETASKQKPADTERVVAQAFADAQRTQATHNRAIKALTRAYESGQDAFLLAFLHCLNRALVVFAREPAVERVVTFVAAFTAANADTFSSPLLEYLVEHSRSSSKGVRFRCVQTIAAVIAALPENAEIADEVFEPLAECALARSRDRVPRVRAAAAGALCRLQSTGMPAEDKVASRLVEMLTCDNSAAVRKSALAAVAVTDGTFEAIMSRTRDVKEDVRKAAYLMLATKLSPYDLDVTERLDLLKAGLRDRKATVRESCATELLLTGWLDNACSGNVFKLVELLGGYTEEDLVLQALATVFKSSNHQHLLQNIEIDINNLSLSDALVLRAMSQIKHADVALDKYIPSALAYAEVLKYYAVDSFASNHLLALGNGLDLSDEAGRRVLETTLRDDFLKSMRVSHETVSPAIEALKAVSFSPESAVLSITQLVRDDVLGDSENSRPESQMVEGAELSPETWKDRRALHICKETLLKCPPTSAELVAPNSAYMELVQITAVRQVLSEINEHRAIALECLGLFCLLDKTGLEARAKIRLFMQACQDEVSVTSVALKVILDFMMVFDLSEEQSEVRQSRVDDGGVIEECLQLVSGFMTSVEASIRTLAVEGMAKLLFTKRVVGTAPVLSRMLIALHNPSTEDDARMQQCLSVFFNAYAMLSHVNRQIVEQTALPTLVVFEEAPSNSPLSTVDIVKVGQFILYLTALGEKDEMVVAQMHARIAEQILNHLLDIADDYAKGDIVRRYSRLLAGMRFDEGMELNGVLLKLTDNAIGFVEEDRRTVASLKKFKERIGAVSTTEKK